MKKEESMVSRRLQKFRAKETQMHRDEILNDSAFTVGRYSGSLCSQQSINMVDSPKAAFVQVTLIEISAWDVCGVHYSVAEYPRRHVDYQKSEKTKVKRL